MPGNTFGQIFRISTFGESHGEAIGVVIDGCPSGIPVDTEKIQQALDRRKPGQSKITTQRKESDTVQILSGIYNGETLGTPITLIVKNEDAKEKDYASMKDVYRPSHADFTYEQKYGIRDYRGGGRSSARETAARVAAGSVAMQMLNHFLPVEIVAWVSQIKNIIAEVNLQKINSAQVDSNIVRCPDKKMAEQMIALIEKVRKEGDTVGGVIDCIIRNVPAGFGEPVFDKLPADFAKAMMSINAAKGFEWGSGFASVNLPGSEHIDIFYKDDSGKIKTKTNHSGGAQGGISNGMDLFFRTAFKPVSTLMKKIKTVNRKGEDAELEMKGRHDPCVLPRAVPIVEAMSALVLADHFLRNEVYRSPSPTLPKGKGDKR